MRYLITGGCGFLGTRLVEALRRQGGHQIRVLDDLSVGSRETLAEVCDFVEIGGPAPETDETRVELVVGDIRDAAVTLRAAAGREVVVHLAASTGVGPSVEDPAFDCSVNVVGTLNVLEAARAQGVGRFVFASSGAPVGECAPPIHEEVVPHPVSPYGAGKLAGEAYCSAYFRSFGLETVALRFSNVYGPGSQNKQSVVARFIRQSRSGAPLEIYGDGLQTRDFIYVGDLVRAILLAASVDGLGGEVFQIATGAETSVLEMVEALSAILEEAGAGGVEIRHGDLRVGDVRRNFADTSKAERFLGWRAEVDLGQGLRQTVAWFLDHGES